MEAFVHEDTVSEAVGVSHGSTRCYFSDEALYGIESFGDGNSLVYVDLSAPLANARDANPLAVPGQQFWNLGRRNGRLNFLNGTVFGNDDGVVRAERSEAESELLVDVCFGHDGRQPYHITPFGSRFSFDCAQDGLASPRRRVFGGTNEQEVHDFFARQELGFQQCRRRHAPFVGKIGVALPVDESCCCGRFQRRRTYVVDWHFHPAQRH